ncbi:BamA/TamA family outer membrane protein [Roseivirga sp. UBA838]|uniref:BamA/TamA family outer membrane protein n=1 Tax=Roseivirga sp. UBA838 TaxID=1947393 RepID=UPI00257C27D9|nr:BamA/TamA family outer membrane protein [Roseivirga sp. UBA838]|tara:strand:+ start:48963 stop:50723 length:1761 start_codon:yes stop_codon:yes gene_type:complete
MPIHRLTFCSCFLLFFLSLLSVQAQQVRLVVTTSANEQVVLNTYNYSGQLVDSVAAVKEVQKLVQLLHQEGYLLAHPKQFTSKEDTLQVEMIIGPRFQWLELRKGNLADDFWRKLNLRERHFNNKPFNPSQLAALEKRILRFAERNAFPFASIKYDSLSIEQNYLSATLQVDLGPPINFDSVRIEQPQILKPKFAMAYLGIHLGQPYNQQLVDAIVPRLRKLNYVKLTRPPLLSFQNSEARVTLSVEKRPVNRLDGIIGFLPNNSRSGGLLVTGQFDLDLYNPFASGRHIGLHWRRLSEETQTLKFNFDQPHLLGSTLSLRSQFDFLKQDSTFNRRVLGLDLNINLGFNANLGVVTHLVATDLIATSAYADSNRLPDILDFRLNRYGLRYSYNGLDDVFFPRRGLSLELNTSIGNKVIRQNAELPNELYTDVDMKTLQLQYDLDVEKYLGLGSRAIFYATLHGGYLSSKNLFRNDAYRLGGLNSIRGFNESYFFATGFAYSNLEYRYFLEDSSYLLLFSDVGYLEQNFVSNANANRGEWALGMGAGISFATGTGIFNFVYALGTADSTGAINFSQSKIHFGFTTRF